MPSIYSASFLALLLLQPAAARRKTKKKPTADIGDLGDLGDLGSLFGDLFANLGDDSLGGGGGGGGSSGSVVGGGKKKKKRRGRQKKSLCDPGTFVAPVSLQSLLNEKPQRQFVANGCGPQGMEIEEPYGLWRCCNGHDVCYSTPGAAFSFCESEFSSCMAKVCDDFQDRVTGKACHEQANGFSSMTKMFGRGSHGGSQRDVTECVKSSEQAHNKWLSFLKEIYAAADMEVSDEKVEVLLAEHRGKEGPLAYSLVKDFGENFVKKTGKVEVEFYKPGRLGVGVGEQEAISIDAAPTDANGATGGYDSGDDFEL